MYLKSIVILVLTINIKYLILTVSKRKERQTDMNLDYVLITHCSPTLAGLKQASLLCLPRLGNGCTYDKIIENIIINITLKACISASYMPVPNAPCCMYTGRPGSGRTHSGGTLLHFCSNSAIKTARTYRPCWTILPRALQKAAVSLMNQAFSSAIPWRTCAGSSPTRETTLSSVANGKYTATLMLPPALSIAIRAAGKTIWTALPLGQH